MTKKYLYFAAFLLALSFGSLPSARAQIDNNAGIKPKVLSDIMRLAPEVKIDEPIMRDALLVGGSVAVNSPAGGDLFLAGGDIALRSDVAGDVRVLGGRVVLDGKIGGNVTVVGGEILFDKGSDISGNVFLAGGAALLDGRVGGNIIARVEDGRNFRVSHTAKIEGSINYRAQSENDNLSQNAALGGVVFEKSPGRPDFNRFFNVFNLLTFFGLLVVGLFFVSLAPKTMRGLLNDSLKKPAPDLFRGVVTLLAAPLLILFLALTMIGLPLALILLVGYVLIIYLSGIFSGLGLGIYLARLAKGREWSERISLIWLMVVGVAVLWALGRIPVFGLLIQLASVIWGLGLIVRLKWQVIKQLER